MTQWRPVPNWEGEYSISASGQVRSEARTVTKANGLRHTVRERIMRPVDSRWPGHPAVQLSRPGCVETHYIATLLKTAWPDT